MTTGTELERTTFERFMAAADDSVEVVNPDEVALDIIRRILSAETVDDVLGGAGALHAKDYIEVPFKLTGVRFNESGYDGAGPQFYALLDGADRDGKSVVVTCGARNVIAQAWRLADMKALPVDVQLRQSEKETARGYRVMWLERAPEAF